MKFTIETVSKLTGVPASSLRNWEKRYGFPQPERTDGGHRYYSAKDVEFLKEAAKWIDSGLCLPELKKVYEEKVLKCPCPIETTQNIVDNTKQMSSLTDDVDYRVDLIYKSLLQFDSISCLQNYQILNAKLSPEHLFDRVFEVILRKLGVEWAQGQISVAQEHFGSSFIRLKMAGFLAMDYPPTQKSKILTCTVDGERHEGGIMLITSHLKLKGYPVYYFGTELPLLDLRLIVDSVQPDIVCLSYMEAETLRRDLPELMKLGVPTCVGGPALCRDSFEELTNHLEQTKEILQATKHNKLYLCHQSIGSQAARFVEMLCQTTAK